MERSNMGSEANDASERKEDLARMAARTQDAVWDDAATGRRLPGLVALLSSDLGPKGSIAAGLRGLSVQSRVQHEQVPFGTTTPGTGRYILAAMLLVVAMLCALLALIWWLVA